MRGAGIQWVAYSANGTAEGDVVYCHHGRVEDFKKLQQLGVSLEGKIALIRYSHGFRGDKVRFAQQYGAIGAILYSDPAEVARDGISQSKIYPSTDWMPEHGVQLGTLMHGYGDPLSPIYPSKPDLYPRRTIEDAKKLAILPSIPVLPISYSDAYEILKLMKGNIVPQEWQGGINVTYKLGPGLTNGKVRIDVNAKLDKR
uniref:PA domain-containing protein n=1 Tax=Acrobeloides nanus TaxID=290746 RepID=A0A914CA24_9BILA